MRIAKASYISYDASGNCMRIVKVKPGIMGGIVRLCAWTNQSTVLYADSGSDSES
jgi:hypothetical protein